MTIEVTTTIDATPGEVWAILMDVERWPEWTPTMKSVRRLQDGPLGLGATARISQPRLPAATWKVTSFEPLHQFAWEAALFGGQMVGGHRVEPEGSGTKLTLTLDRRGGLLGVIGWMFDGTARGYATQEAAGLKARAEGPVAGASAEALSSSS